MNPNDHRPEQPPPPQRIGLPLGLPDPFAPPAGYLDGFSARLMQRLHGLPETAHEPFTAPPSYFEDLPLRLMQQLEGLPGSVHSAPQRFQWRRNWAWVPVGAVAALALVVLTVLPQQRNLNELNNLSLGEMQWPMGHEARQYVQNEMMYAYDEYEIAQAFTPSPDGLPGIEYAVVDTPPPGHNNSQSGSIPPGTPVTAGADTALFDLQRGLDDLFNTTDTDALMRELWIEAGSETVL